MLASAHIFKFDEVEVPHDRAMLGPSIVGLLAFSRCVCVLWMLNFFAKVRDCYGKVLIICQGVVV